jgi:Tol biopolymer transport system component
VAALALAGACGSSVEERGSSIAARFGRAVFVLEPDGSWRRKLPALGGAPYVEWSPDGEWIAFGNGDLFAVRPDGSGRRLVARDAESLSWAPDGEQLVFMRAVCIERDVCPDVDNPYELFTVAVEGGSPRRITHNTGYDGNPAWSPDGRQIAFETDTGLFTMRPDGTRRRRLTARYDSNPDWSPDGRLVAFDDFADIYVVAADGGRRRRLTSNPGPDFQPAWSPDGRLIAYLSNPICAQRGGCTAHEPWLIRVMNSDGTRPRNLTGYGWGAAELDTVESATRRPGTRD